MSALVQIMAWRRTGAKPLSDPMMTQSTDAYMRQQAWMWWYSWKAATHPRHHDRSRWPDAKHAPWANTNHYTRFEKGLEVGNPPVYLWLVGPFPHDPYAIWCGAAVQLFRYQDVEIGCRGNWFMKFSSSLHIDDFPEVNNLGLWRCGRPWFNSLAPGGYDRNFESIISKLIIQNSILGTRYKIDLRWRHKYENVFRVTGPLFGEFTGHQWNSPHTGFATRALMFSLL